MLVHTDTASVLSCLSFLIYFVLSVDDNPTLVKYDAVELAIIPYRPTSIGNLVFIKLCHLESFDFFI